MPSVDTSRPVVTPSGGSYTDPVAVTISHEDSDVELRYTTSFYHHPTAESDLYDAPLEVREKTYLRAQAYRDGEPVGEAVAAGFMFFDPAMMAAEYDWQPQPEKAAMMIVFAHPDDEVVPFRGAIPLYGTVRKLPLVNICMSNREGVEKDQMRRKEMEAAFHAYGLPNAPLYANFPDDCYGRPVTDCMNTWGMMETVSYVTEQVRRYKPDVILTHDFYGEYGHPNHIVTAIACFDAFKMANDPGRFPEQVESLGLWQPRKLYAHKAHHNSWIHDWDTPCPELGGRTPQEVAQEGVSCHKSQEAGFVDYQGHDFGLILSSVGPDVKTGDFFENIDTTIYQTVPSS